MHFHTPSLILLPLLPLTTAHVKLIHPTPYAATTLNTNPLLPTGADYPCKLRPSAYAITSWTTIPHNEPQPLAFQGQATHGGGSCQVSLTRDVPPTAASVFRVVKSIEGGCPSGQVGNVGEDPAGYGADVFEFVVGEEVGVGEYTLAWTWFNRVGEREMYMNCAPVRVVAGGGAGAAVGGGGRRRGRRGAESKRRGEGFDGLPVMFRANIGNGCETAVSGTVLGFPEANLGSVVQRIGDEVLVPPVGRCGVEGKMSVSSEVVSNSTEVPVAVPSVAPPTSTSHASLVPAPSGPVSSPAY